MSPVVQVHSELLNSRNHLASISNKIDQQIKSRHDTEIKNVSEVEDVEASPDYIVVRDKDESPSLVSFIIDKNALNITDPLKI